MFNLTFLNTAFLFALSVAVLPILIHLLNREKVKRVYFSTLRYLHLLQKTRMKRVRLRQIILLILRTLALLLLALAFARPALKGALSGLVGAHAKISAAILLDNSLSMGAAGLFREARGKGELILDMLKEGDEADLITFSDHPHPLLPSPTHNLSLVGKGLAKAELSDGGTNLKEAFTEAISTISRSKNLNREIYLITDLRRYGWGKIVAQGLEIPAGVRLYIIHPEPNQPRNATIGSVELGGGGMMEEGKSLELDVEIKNNSSSPFVNLTTELFLDGRRMDQKNIDLKPGQEGKVKFDITPEGGGNHWGWVQIPDDELNGDNRRYFNFTIPERIRVLCVGGKREDIFYLQLALNPLQEKGFSVETTPCEAGELSGFLLSDFDVLALANVGSLNPDRVAALEGFLEEGGGLFISLGEGIDPRFFNQGPFGLISPLTLGPLMGIPHQKEIYFSLEKMNYSHPIFSIFQGKRITPPAFFLAYQGEIKKGSQGLAWFSNGLPALVEGKVSRGRVIAFTSALDPEWSDLPTSGLIVPLLQRVVRYLAATRFQTSRETLVGEGVEVTLKGKEGNVTCLRPDGEKVALERVLRGTNFIVRLPEMDTKGIWKLFSDEKEIEIFSVNPDPKESDPAQMEQKEVEGLIRGGKTFFIPWKGDLGKEIQEARYGRELWRTALWLVLGILAIEVLLGRQKG